MEYSYGQQKIDDIEQRLKELALRRTYLEQKSQERQHLWQEFSQIRAETNKKMLQTMQEQNEKAIKRNQAIMEDILLTINSFQQRTQVILPTKDNKGGVTNKQPTSAHQRLANAKKEYYKTIENQLPYFHRQESLKLEEKLQEIKQEKLLALQRRERLRSEFLREERIRMELENQKHELIQTLALEQQDYLEKAMFEAMLVQQSKQRQTQIMQQVLNQGGNHATNIENNNTGLPLSMPMPTESGRSYDPPTTGTASTNTQQQQPVIMTPPLLPTQSTAITTALPTNYLMPSTSSSQQQQPVIVTRDSVEVATRGVGAQASVSAPVPVPVLLTQPAVIAAPSLPLPQTTMSVPVVAAAASSAQSLPSTTQAQAQAQVPAAGSTTGTANTMPTPQVQPQPQPPSLQSVGPYSSMNNMSNQNIPAITSSSNKPPLATTNNSSSSIETNQPAVIPSVPVAASADEVDEFTLSEDEEEETNNQRDPGGTGNLPAVKPTVNKALAMVESKNNNTPMVHAAEVKQTKGSDDSDDHEEKEEKSTTDTASLKQSLSAQPKAPQLQPPTVAVAAVKDNKDKEQDKEKGRESGNSNSSAVIVSVPSTPSGNTVLDSKQDVALLTTLLASKSLTTSLFPLLQQLFTSIETSLSKVSSIAQIYPLESSVEDEEESAVQQQQQARSALRAMVIAAQTTATSATTAPSSPSIQGRMVLLLFSLRLGKVLCPPALFTGVVHYEKLKKELKKSAPMVISGNSEDGGEILVKCWDRLLRHLVLCTTTEQMDDKLRTQLANKFTQALIAHLQESNKNSIEKEEERIRMQRKVLNLLQLEMVQQQAPSPSKGGGTATLNTSSSVIRPTTAPAPTISTSFDSPYRPVRPMSSTVNTSSYANQSSTVQKPSEFDDDEVVDDEDDLYMRSGPSTGAGAGRPMSSGSGIAGGGDLWKRPVIKDLDAEMSRGNSNTSNNNTTGNSNARVVNSRGGNNNISSKNYSSNNDDEVEEFDA